MTMRLSTGLRNAIAKYGAIGDMLHNGYIEIYSGAQPSSADAAPTGTLLCTITDTGAAFTPEVLATGTVALNTGAAGSINTVTVNGIDILGGAVPFNGTLAQTAADVAAQINRNTSAPDYTATVSGSTVTISALPGTGTSPNGFVVAVTETTIVSTTTNMAGGVAAANGLHFDVVSSGTLSKRNSQTWSGVNAATGTGGWFRQYGSVADSKALDSTGTAIRMDGAVGTSGAEMNLNSTAFTSGATTTLATWAMTVPAQ